MNLGRERIRERKREEKSERERERKRQRFDDREWEEGERGKGVEQKERRENFT